MVQFIIHHNDGNYIFIEAETLKEAEAQANQKMIENGWLKEDCWSEHT